MTLKTTNNLTKGAIVAIIRALQKYGPLTVEQMTEKIRPKFWPRLHAALGLLERAWITYAELADFGSGLRAVHHLKRKVRLACACHGIPLGEPHTRDNTRECKADAA